MEVTAQNPVKLGPIGTPTEKNEGFLLSKVANSKHPEVKLNGSINHEKMRML